MRSLTGTRLAAEDSRLSAHHALAAVGVACSIANAVSCHHVGAELAGHPNHGLRLMQTIT